GHQTQSIDHLFYKFFAAATVKPIYDRARSFPASDDRKRAKHESRHEIGEKENENHRPAPKAKKHHARGDSLRRNLNKHHPQSLSHIVPSADGLESQPIDEALIIMIRDPKNRRAKRQHSEKFVKHSF